MNTLIKGLALASVAALPLAIISIVQGDDLIAGFSGQPNSRSRGSEGERRDEMLVQLTKRYVTQGSDVTMAMREGREFAPIYFLNAELERAGAKWRVSSSEGVTAETFSIS
jgi:hypothetical protein